MSLCGIPRLGGETYFSFSLYMPHDRKHLNKPAWRTPMSLAARLQPVTPQPCWDDFGGRLPGQALAL